MFIVYSAAWRYSSAEAKAEKRTKGCEYIRRPAILQSLHVTLKAVEAVKKVVNIKSLQ